MYYYVVKMYLFDEYYVYFVEDGLKNGNPSCLPLFL